MKSFQLTAPKNAAELRLLLEPTPTRPTMVERMALLASIHARGATLPNTGLTDADHAAWARYCSPPPAAKPAPTQRSAPAPAPAAAAAIVKPAAAPAIRPATAAPAAGRLHPVKPPKEPAPSRAEQLQRSLRSGKLTPRAEAEIRAELVRLNKTPATAIGTYLDARRNA